VSCGSRIPPWLKSGFSVTSNVTESLATNSHRVPRVASNLSTNPEGAARLLSESVVGQQSIRNELNVPARRHIVQAGNRSKLLVNPSRAGSRMAIIYSFLREIVPISAPPGLLRIAREPQALERNRKRDQCSPRSDAAALSHSVSS